MATTNKVHYTSNPQSKKTGFKTIALTRSMCSFFLFVFLMQLKIMSWNTRGVISSTVCLAKLLRQSNPDYVVLSEHKLPPRYSKYLDSVDSNYYTISKCEPQNNNELYGKAGFAIMIKKSLMFNVQELEIASSRIVALECKVNTHERVYLVGAYLPADNNIEMYKMNCHYYRIYIIVIQNMGML